MTPLVYLLTMPSYAWAFLLSSFHPCAYIELFPSLCVCWAISILMRLMGYFHPCAPVELFSSLCVPRDHRGCFRRWKCVRRVENGQPVRLAFRSLKHHPIKKGMGTFGIWHSSCGLSIPCALFCPNNPITSSQSDILKIYLDATALASLGYKVNFILYES